MSVTLKIVSYADGTASPLDGQYLVDYDPTWVYHPVMNDAGFAKLVRKLETTADRSKAKLYATPTLAFEEWRRVSPNRPLRPGPDYQPNRPLTAFSIEVEKV